MTHACPASPCTASRPPAQVSDDMLMCGKDWRRVPPELQRRVYAAWRRGAGAGSDEHNAAIREAIRSVSGAG